MTTIDRQAGVKVAAAAAVSATTSYVVYTVAARVLHPVGLNTLFITFWAALFAGYGVVTGLAMETTRAVTAAELEARPSSTGRPKVVAMGLVFAAGAAIATGASALVWGPRVFATSPAALSGAIVVGIAAYAMHSVVVGSLAGRGLWGLYAGVITADALVRVLLVVLAAVVSARVPVMAFAAALAGLTWSGFVALSPTVRHSLTGRVDSSGPRFLRRSFAASVSAGASAMLVVGFPTLLSATTPAGAYSGAAPLLLALTVTRAPLLIPLNAFQGIALSHFTRHQREGLRAIAPLAGAIGGLTVVSSTAMALVGPWLIRTVFGPSYQLSGGLLVSLTLAAGLLALLTLTGVLCQASTAHGPFLAGWLLALAVAFGVLLLPLPLQTRSVAALILGPICGSGLHLIALARRGKGSPAGEAAPQPASSPIR